MYRGDKHMKFSWTVTDRPLEICTQKDISETQGRAYTYEYIV